MTPPLRRVDKLPDRVYRIGRAPDPWAWPDWAFADDDQTFGNRFDDPDGQYRVLYASSEREATFRECLARYRPDPAIVEAAIEDDGADPRDPGSAPPGRVPMRRLWTRCMGAARLAGPFCDIGHSASLAHLRSHLAARLARFGLDDPMRATSAPVRLAP